MAARSASKGRPRDIDTSITYFGIAMLVMSVVVIAVGIWYQYFRKQAKS